MSAEEMRQYIMLVESARTRVAEADIGRRGLFRGAAALAAVAALPQKAKEQAVELITKKGPELLSAVIDAVESGVNLNDIYWVNDMLHYYGEEVHPLDIVPDQHRDDALKYATGQDLDGDPATEEDEERFNDMLYKMSDDERMELLRKTWYHVVPGDDPSWYYYYQMTKRYPSLLGKGNPYEEWDLLRDFLPKDRNRRGFVQHNDNSGLDNIRAELEYRKTQLARGVDATWLEPEIKRLEQLVKDHGTTQQHRLPQGTAQAKHTDAKSTTPSVPKLQAPPIGTRALLSPVLRAADTILKAFRRVDQVSNVALDMLKDLKPEDIKLTMQQDAGQEPAQQPAALPAPGPKIDLGLDRLGPFREPVAVRRDQT